jgi:hypothetical protein
MATVKTETKRERTIRLANKRVNAALGKIALIGNLGNANYEVTQADADAIETALYNAVDAACKRFGKMVDDKPQFELNN